MFYALETLNKSYICLENLNDCEFIEDLTSLSLFLQKGVEYYKFYKNFMINEKIKKLNCVNSNTNINENEYEEVKKNKGNEYEKNNGESTIEKKQCNNCKELNNEKKVNGSKNKMEVESKVKQFISKNEFGKEKKIDEITKIKKEIQVINDQNSKLQWEIERDVMPLLII